MWMRILTGELAGQKFELRQGDNFVGRAPDCDVVLNIAGISKKHACIRVDGTMVTVTDLKSSNGTYINGVRILKKDVRSPADKIGFHNILTDIKSQAAAKPRSQNQGLHFEPPAYPTQGANAMAQGMPASSEPNLALVEALTPIQKLQKYIDEVAMPGIYHLVENFEFKFVIGGMILSFIILMTFFSVLPMMQITKSSVEKESRRRALTIARNLASVNQAYLQQGVETAVSTKAAEREEGVQISLIVSNRDGHVIAPMTNLGEYPDQPFVHRARKENREMVEQLSDELIGAAVPISAYSPDAGQQVIAHAVVLYDMGSLAIDNERYISLFAQILLISLILGFVLYFFLIKLFEEPILQMSLQLDEALKNDTKNLNSKFQIPSLRILMTNINSLLQRNSNADLGQELANIDYAGQANNIVRLMSNPAAAIDKEKLILSVNPAFEDLVGMRLLTLQGQSLELLQDQALKMSVYDLLEQSLHSPSFIMSNKLDFSGVPYDVDLQCVQGPGGVAYYLLCLRKQENML